MNVHVITVPYHLDRADLGTGEGPRHLLEQGVTEAILRAGHEVCAVSTVRLEGDRGHETGNIFALVDGLAARVRAARAADEFPLVLAGDCSNAIGVMAGLGGGPPPGLVWLDTHGDANTPQTTTSGFFDGFPLAVLLGWCWQALAARVTGFTTLDAGAVMHLGGRAFDPGEREALAAAGVNVIDAAALRLSTGRARVAESVQRLGGDGRVHVHLDLDVIDPADGIASGYAAEGGPSPQALIDTLRSLAAQREITSAAICAYDPSFDSDGRAARTAITLLDAVLAGLPERPVR